MRGIAITNRRAKGGETNMRGDSGQRRQHGPAFQERLIGRAHAGDLDHIIQDGEPHKAVMFCPLCLRLHRLERLAGINTLEPGRVVDAELHGYWLVGRGFDFCLGAVRSSFAATRRAAASARYAQATSSSGSSNSRSGARQKERSMIETC